MMMMASSSRFVSSILFLRKNSIGFSQKNLLNHISLGRYFSLLTKEGNKPCFGFLFDIDGVIVRGKRLLPSAKEAFRLLTDGYGKFRVPALFVTNAGNMLRSEKAKQLSNWLGIQVESEQVIMSHSPLKMFRQFHDKHVLVSGQGPVLEIAKNLGFTKVTTIETLRQTFPLLDMVDHQRRHVAPCAFEKYFPRIEAVILFGEPVRWETNLQLITDVLLSNGLPNRSPREIPYPHLPILACNMDLLWMSEACMPRFGHGCFMHCLECLYQKITGRELKYTALIGKPSEITYHHADYLLSLQAQNIGVKGVQTIYCIGDNPETDIYGGNLYNRYLQSQSAKQRGQEKLVQQIASTTNPGVHDEATSGFDDTIETDESMEELISSLADENVIITDNDNPETDIYGGNLYNRYLQSQSAKQRGQEKLVQQIASTTNPGVHDEATSGFDDTIETDESMEELISSLADENVIITDKSVSILVCTGVYTTDSDFVTYGGKEVSNHNHRDFVLDNQLKQPTYVTQNVLEAVKLVYDLEKYH